MSKYGAGYYYQCYRSWVRNCIAKDPSGPPLSAIPIGKNVLIRGVTLYYVGHVESISDHEIVLSSASWVADTGRFHDALQSGTLSEVEPYPDGLVVIGRAALMDCCEWRHELPRDVK